MNIVFCYSNTSHLEASLPLISALKNSENEVRVCAIVDAASGHYGVNLEHEVLRHSSKFHAVLFLRKSKTKNILSMIKGALKNKRDIKKFLTFEGEAKLFAFTEGARIEWLCLGVANSLNIHTFCVQWAITWRPHVYSSLRPDVPSWKRLLQFFVFFCLGMNYPRMKYLGDGGAQTFLTMSDYFTKQFQDTHQLKKNKFITFGQASFADFKENRCYSKKPEFVLTTGAGTFLYKDSINNHLADILDIYESFNKAYQNNPRMKLYHRPHPRDICYKQIQEMAEKYECVEVTITPLKELLKYSDGLITIRSTTGFEALLSGATVIVYDSGRIPIPFHYARLGLAYEANNGQELTDILTLDNLEKVELSKIEEFISTDNALVNFMAICDKDPIKKRG